MAYWPGPAPKGQEYARQEFEKIAAELRQLTSLQFKVLHVEPDKPRDGMIVIADGTDWDPGSGAGAYVYLAGWQFLG